MRGRPAWKSIYSPESTQSSHFRGMSTISDFRNVNTLNWRSSPELLGKSINRKGTSTKKATYDPGKSYPPMSFRYFKINQLDTLAIPRRPTAFSSKRGHSALLLPVDKLKISPLGDTGKASSITVDNE